MVAYSLGFRQYDRQIYVSIKITFLKWVSNLYATLSCRNCGRPYVGSLRLWSTKHSVGVANSGRSEAWQFQRRRTDDCDASTSRHEPLKTDRPGRAALLIPHQRSVPGHRATEGRLPGARSCHTTRGWRLRACQSSALGSQAYTGMSVIRRGFSSS